MSCSYRTRGSLTHTPTIIVSSYRKFKMPSRKKKGKNTLTIIIRKKRTENPDNEPPNKCETYVLPSNPSILSVHLLHQLLPQEILVISNVYSSSHRRPLTQIPTEGFEARLMSISLIFYYKERRKSFLFFSNFFSISISLFFSIFVAV